MQCMKCGRDTDEGQVFCEACRKAMAAYPVKSGVVVQLPHRPQPIQRKQNQRRRATLTLEDQVQLLRRMVRRQILLIVLLFAAVIGLSWLSVKLYLESEKKVLPGQNYFTAAETNEPETVPTTLPEYDIAG